MIIYVGDVLVINKTQSDESDEERINWRARVCG